MKAGDLVLSRNEDDDGTEEVHEQRITQTFIRKTDTLYILTFEDGTRLETTWNHPFFIEGKGWTEAKDLKEGDRSIVASTGKVLRIAEITQDHLGGEVNVYNFEVEGDHTYFVGEGEVWVHNAGYADTLKVLAGFSVADGVPGDELVLVPLAIAAAADESCGYCVTNTLVDGAGSVIKGISNAASDAWDYVFGASDSLPVPGTPGTWGRLLQPDGTPKQDRKYGPDGWPEIDIDYDHGEHHPDIVGPHVHDWDPPQEGKKPKRGKAREPKDGEIPND